MFIASSSGDDDRTVFIASSSGDDDRTVKIAVSRSLGERGLYFFHLIPPLSMSRQATHEILMIEPVCFGVDQETLHDNHLQHRSGSLSDGQIQKAALAEFMALRDALTSSGVIVRTYKDIQSQETPDSIFPNNWFSTHADGTLVLYPMKVSARRRERRSDIIADLKKRYSRLIDLSSHELHGNYLESTGSLVLDRVNRVAYACLSARTNWDLAQHWSKEIGYSVIPFEASDMAGRPIYHTNVMMAVGSNWAVVCLDAIESTTQREMVRGSLEQTGHRIITINADQVSQFCGNVLELETPQGRAIVISQCALEHFDATQLEQLEEFGKIISVAVPTIERIGGGGVRCMLAELF